MNGAILEGTRTPRVAIAAWLVGLAGCIAIVANTRFTADMSAFLPRNASAEQQILVDQLRDGALSRLLLIGIEGGDAASRGRISRTLAAALRTDDAFAAVHNGDPAETERDRSFLR